MVSPATTEVSTDGYGPLEAALRTAGEAQQDLSSAFTQIMFQFQEEQEQVFASSGAFGGRTVWKPLSEKYAAWKEKVIAGAPILTLASIMRESLTDAEATGAVRVVTADELFIGVDFMVGGYNLAELHHTGTKRGLPKREPIRVTEDQMDTWTEIIARHLVGERSEIAWQ